MGAVPGILHLEHCDVLHPEPNTTERVRIRLLRETETNFTRLHKKGDVATNKTDVVADWVCTVAIFDGVSVK